MSYQIAIVIKADSALKNMFSVDRPENKTDQIGWWIPLRGEDNPPEKYMMTLADVYLKSNVKNTHIEMRQTLYKAGLYDPPGKSIKNYKEFDTDFNIAKWTFDSNNGTLASWNMTSSSKKSSDDFWVPVPDKCLITDDLLILTIEGNSLKQNLPDLRAGSKFPITFQIINFDTVIQGYVLRQKFTKMIYMSDDVNGCNLPDTTCKPPPVQKEGAFSLTSLGVSFAIASLTFLSF